MIDPTFIDVLDTFYFAVSQNIALLKPTQAMHGMIGVQDWPQVNIDLNGGLYLLYLTSAVVPEKSRPAQEFYDHFLQWTWAVQGNDIQAANVDANRGDRWRSNVALQELLRQAHFPGFAQKRSIQAYDPTVANGTFTPYSPIEMIYWTAPKLAVKYNKDAGILYGTATLEVSAYSTVNPLVNQ